MASVNHNKKHHRRLSILLIQIMLLSIIEATQATAEPIRIGVLSHRGDSYTHYTWSPTANYLTGAVPGHRFEIVPLGFDKVESAVAAKEVDFVLASSSIYVSLEARHRVSRIATLNNKVGGVAHNLFGGVIFARADRSDIKNLRDLRGKRFIAVDRNSLGGFQMAWRELLGVDITPYRDFSQLAFGNTHDKVVMAVKNGKMDAGTVRTGILESMAHTGRIDLEEFKIISPGETPEFPRLHSTRLYPEWPFSKVGHTSNQLAQQVAVALLSMPEDHLAAQVGSYSGWTIPLDYQSVHDLSRELNLPPYDKRAEFTLLDVMQRYWEWIIATLIFLFSMGFMVMWVWRLNRKLQKTQLCLERQHNLILESVADGICGIDTNGVTTFVNSAMEKLTGWQADDLIGRKQHPIIHHTHADGTPHPATECPIHSTHRDGKPRFIADDTFWKKDGSSIPVEYTSTPLHDDRKQIIGSVVVFRDTTERRKMEEQLHRYKNDLAHMARLNTMGEMASGMAHEINQPLTAIAANSDACIRLLESGSEDREQIIDTIERIGAQARRTGDIIKQMRQFARREEPQLQSINLNTRIREAMVMLEPEIRRHEVRIDLLLDKHIPPVMAQPIQIDQVVTNLIQNAIDAMDEQPADQRKLSVATSISSDHTIITHFSDSGGGIPEPIRQTLFDPFITTKREGMGMGLSICKSIIELHNGSLYLESTSNSGSTFCFTLPQSKENTAP